MKDAARTTKTITFQTLELYLEAIDWGLSHRGTDIWAIHNHKDELTAFTFQHDPNNHEDNIIINELGAFFEDRIFGGSYMGNFRLKLDDARLSLMNPTGKSKRPNWIVLETPSTFISFYNFDMNEEK